MSQLQARERDAFQVCFGRELDPERANALGDARIWGIYREMVRGRLLGELKHALPRSHALAGAQAFERAFAQHLEHAPPRSRYFHGIVGDFARSASAWFRSQSELPPQLADLLEYEAACWAVGDLPDAPEDQRAPDALSEFSFDAEVVLSPALRLLSLRYPVHRRDAGAAEHGEPRETLLCIHRRPEDKKARTWVLTPVTYALMQRLQRESGSVATALEQVASARKLVIDETFLDGLCTVLADFIERGVILGCRTR